MKPARSNGRASRRREGGFATVLIFILLTIMVTFVVANSLTLHHLKQELRLIEKQQLKKYPGPTNAPPILKLKRNPPP